MPSAIFCSLVVFLIYFSCLAYASLTIFTLAATQFISLTIISYWFIETVSRKRSIFIKSKLILFAGLFLALLIFQLIPLPLSLIRVISYKTASLYNSVFSGGQLPLFLPLSIYPDATVSGLLNMFVLFGIFFVIINRIEQKRDFDFLINAIIILGIAISVLGIIQKLSFSTRIYWFDQVGSASLPFGPFANHNNFAGYINMIIPLALGYLLTDISLPRKIIYGSGVGLMSVALFMTLSRAGILVFLAAMAFFLVLLRSKDISRFKVKIVYLYFMILAILLLFFVDFVALWDRMGNLFIRKAPVVFGHGYSWLDILRMWSDFPLFGIGMGAFGNLSPMYNSGANTVLFTYAHNDYLQLLAETGVIGAVLLLFFAFCIRPAFKMWVKRRNQYAVYLSLGGFTSLFSISVYSFLDFNMHIPATALLFFVILGLTYKLAGEHFNRATSQHRDTDAKDVSYGMAGYKLRSKATGLIIFSLLILYMAAYMVFIRTHAEHNLARGKYFLEKAQSTSSEALVDKSIFYQRALEFTDKACRLSRLNGKAYSQYAVIASDISVDRQLSNSINVNGFGVDIQGAKRFLELAREKYAEAIAVEPTNSTYHLMLASVYDKLSQDKEAVLEFERALLLNPNSISIRIQLSKYFLSRGNYEEYMFHLVKAVSLYEEAGLKGGGGPISDMLTEFLKDTGQERLLK